MSRKFNYSSIAATLAICFIPFAADRLVAQEIGAPPYTAEVEGDIDVLTRGPVHEAFAEVVSYDPKPGEVTPKAPPEPIDEIPPDARPEGDDVVWISGYWAYDDDRDDFLWISGVWRKAPPGLRWVDGYWNKLTTDDGTDAWQWVSGFWAPAEAAGLDYLDAPPATLERGPSSPSPGDDYFWTPGVWTWHTTAYRWQPGYWNTFRPGWVWVPTRYIWTPRGFLCRGGYWDYPFAYRGHLYAPIYYNRPIYRQPRYAYSPRIVIGGPAISLHLFFRPNYGRVYFGDYYGPQYARRNYHSCLDFHVQRRGYDPIFAYNQVSFGRSGINYEQRVRGWQSYFTSHADMRPPHTFVAQREFSQRNARHEHLAQTVLATPLADLAARPDGKQTLVRLSTEQRQAAARVAVDRSNIVNERKRIETPFAGKPTVPDRPGTPGRPLDPRDPDKRPALPKVKLDLPADPRVTTRVTPPTQDPSRDPRNTVRRPGERNPGDRGPDDDPRRPGVGRPGQPSVDNTPKLDPRPKVDPPKVNPPKVNPPRVDPPKVTPPKATPPKATPPKVDPRPRVEPPKVNTPKVEPPKVTPPSVAPPRGDPRPRVEPPKVNTPKVEPPKAAPPRVDPRPKVEAPPRGESPPRAIREAVPERRPPAVAPRVRSEPPPPARPAVQPQPRVVQPPPRREEPRPSAPPRQPDRAPKEKGNEGKPGKGRSK